MAYSSAGDGAPEHVGDVVLDQEVGEALGAMTASESDHRRTGNEKCPRHPEATPDIA
jgi:hypothetical protein